MKNLIIADELRSGKTVISYTKGGSMRPLLKQGVTAVTIVPLYGEPKCGDIVLFLQDNKYILHRIVKRKGEIYYTRGDNCADHESVMRDQMLGVVTEIMKGDSITRVSDVKYRAYAALWRTTGFIRKPFYRIRSRVKKSRRSGICCKN